jgi:hypothetical protein
MKRARLALGVAVAAFGSGALVAWGVLKREVARSPSIVSTAEQRIAGVVKILSDGPAPGETCPELSILNVVPTIELDDLQGVSSDWRFLSDENTLAVRANKDPKASDAIEAAKHLVVFIAPTAQKRLPTADQEGQFDGSMVLVDLDAKSVVCQQPLSVHAPANAFRQSFRGQALVVAQKLSVRIGLPHCR